MRSASQGNRPPPRGARPYIPIGAAPARSGQPPRVIGAPAAARPAPAPAGGAGVTAAVADDATVRSPWVGPPAAPAPMGDTFFGVSPDDCIRVRAEFDTLIWETKGGAESEYLDAVQLPELMRRLAMQSWGIPDWSSSVRSRVQALANTMAQGFQISYDHVVNLVAHARQTSASAPAAGTSYCAAQAAIVPFNIEIREPGDILARDVRLLGTFPATSHTELADIVFYCDVLGVEPIKFAVECRGAAMGSEDAPAPAGVAAPAQHGDEKRRRCSGGPLECSVI